MNYCSTCKHAVFDAWWGEYKCENKHHVIFAGEGKDFPCREYKNGTPKESVRNKYYHEKLESND